MLGLLRGPFSRNADGTNTAVQLEVSSGSTSAAEDEELGGFGKGVTDLSMDVQTGGALFSTGKGSDCLSAGSWHPVQQSDQS